MFSGHDGFVMVFAKRDRTLMSMTAAGGTGKTAPEKDQAEKIYVWAIAVDGIATFRLLSAAVFTLDLARAAITDLSALTDGGHMPPILVDIRRSGGITREARTYLGDPTGKYVALALLAGSASTQMIANFFIGLNHPKIPTRVFTDEEKALRWLRAYIPTPTLIAEDKAIARLHR
jgi:hypothetical protein